MITCEHNRGLTIDNVCIYCWRERALKAEAEIVGLRKRINVNNETYASLAGEFKLLYDRIHQEEPSVDRPCEHEPDGRVYTSMPPKWRCVKCGEYYRGP